MCVQNTEVTPEMVETAGMIEDTTISFQRNFKFEISGFRMKMNEILKNIYILEKS